MTRTPIDLLCALRSECRDWAEALCGGREGLDELLAEVDSMIAESAQRDGYLCRRCQGAVPHDSDTCPHCGAA